MKRIFLRLKQPLRNERGEITFFACFFVVGIVMLISFLLLYASIRITCINIRNGAKMELNNLSGTIYADTYRSQRETNFEEYLNTLYSSSDYTDIRLGNKLLLILMVFLGIRVTEIIFRPLIAHIIRHIAAICLLSGTRAGSACF